MPQLYEFKTSGFDLGQIAKCDCIVDIQCTVKDSAAQNFAENFMHWKFLFGSIILHELNVYYICILIAPSKNSECNIKY